MRMRPFAAPADAYAHYTRRLELETDCADVHAALAAGDPGFVLIDVRARTDFEDGHIPGATSIPRASITAERMVDYPPGTRFVAYCWGPHCNAATKAAAVIAALGFPVKEMPGGVWGWEMDGHELV